MLYENFYIFTDKLKCKLVYIRQKRRDRNGTREVCRQFDASSDTTCGMCINCSLTDKITKASKPLPVRCVFQINKLTQVIMSLPRLTFATTFYVLSVSTSLVSASSFLHGAKREIGIVICPPLCLY